MTNPGEGFPEDDEQNRPHAYIKITGSVGMVEAISNLTSKGLERATPPGEAVDQEDDAASDS